MKILPVFLLLLAGATVAQTANAKLPSEVTTALNQDFPGWKVAPVDLKAQQQNEDAGAVARKGFVSGDFDGDGRADYAVMLLDAAGGGMKRVVVAYLNTKLGWQKHVLDTFSARSFNYYLSLSARGETCYVDKSGPFKCPFDAVNMIYARETGVTYIFKSGKFEKIFSGE
jgi:phage FluMu protein Com